MVTHADSQNCPCCRARLLLYRQIVAGRGIDPVTVAEDIAVWLGGTDAMNHWTRSAAFDATVKAHDAAFSLDFPEMAADAAALGLEGEELHDLRFQLAAAMVKSEPALRKAS